jgi:hypothetical protein
MLYDFHRKSCRIMALMRSTRKLDNNPVYLCPTVSELPNSACQAGSEGSSVEAALSSRRIFYPTRRGMIPRMARRSLVSQHGESSRRRPQGRSFLCSSSRYTL